MVPSGAQTLGCARKTNAAMALGVSFAQAIRRIVFVVIERSKPIERIAIRLQNV